MVGIPARLRLPATLAIVWLAWAPSVAQTDTAPSAVEAGVRQALAGYAVAANAGDWQALVEYYADDPGFVWIEDGAVRYRSRQEVAAAFDGLEGVFEAFESSFSEVRVIPLAADAASVSLLFQQAMTTRSGTRFEVEGAILATMVERGGAWRFLAGHTSSRRARPGEDSEASNG